MENNMKICTLKSSLNLFESFFEDNELNVNLV